MQAAHWQNVDALRLLLDLGASTEARSRVSWGSSATFRALAAHSSLKGLGARRHREQASPLCRLLPCDRVGGGRAEQLRRQWPRPSAQHSTACGLGSGRRQTFRLGCCCRRLLQAASLPAQAVLRGPTTVSSRHARPPLPRPRTPPNGCVTSPPHPRVVGAIMSMRGGFRASIARQRLVWVARCVPLQGHERGNGRPFAG